MTDVEKYNELLKEVGQLLREKNDLISIKDYQISTLNDKLAAAEHEIVSLTRIANESTNKWTKNCERGKENGV